MKTRNSNKVSMLKLEMNTVVIAINFTVIEFPSGLFDGDKPVTLGDLLHKFRNIKYWSNLGRVLGVPSEILTDPKFCSQCDHICMTDMLLIWTQLYSKKNSLDDISTLMPINPRDQDSITVVPAHRNDGKICCACENKVYEDGMMVQDVI